jgi:uncharacterized membrane protein YheB (UPF0754 family)
MNKSLATNLIAAAAFAAAWFSPDFPGRTALVQASLFALSGALTNWLAVYMLFDKVPGLYGSGVIPRRFTEFKSGIRTLIITNFFTEENFTKVAHDSFPEKIDPNWIMDKVDLDELFDDLIVSIKGSSLGSMFSMIGGEKVMAPLRVPFTAQCEKRIAGVLEEIDLTEIFEAEHDFEKFRNKVEGMVDHHLDGLTPKMVKDIIERMIRSHLGWLVVWGGVFGALIGVICHFLLGT